MNEQKVTSLELSQELKKAGAPQQSECFYARRGLEWRLYSNATGPARSVGYDGIEEIVAAFDCHELWMSLPMGARMMKALGGYAVEIYGQTVSLGTYPNAPASMLGQLLLWCFENEHCEKVKP